MEGKLSVNNPERIMKSFPLIFYVEKSILNALEIMHELLKL